MGTRTAGSITSILRSYALKGGFRAGEWGHVLAPNLAGCFAQIATVGVVRSKLYQAYPSVIRSYWDDVMKYLSVPRQYGDDITKYYHVLTM